MSWSPGVHQHCGIAPVAPLGTARHARRGGTTFNLLAEPFQYPALGVGQPVVGQCAAVEAVEVVGEGVRESWRAARRSSRGTPRRPLGPGCWRPDQ